MEPILRVLLLAATTCLAAAACVKKQDLVVWKTEQPSPDGQWIASADTIQNGGFGSASVDTVVYLTRRADLKHTQEVLVFHCQDPVPHPYTLDNVANQGGTINLRMSWVTPSHLQVTYSRHPDLQFQVARYAGIEITAQDASDAPRTTQ
jgi:hypothetical protein